MHIEAEKWAKYWRASLADSQGVNPNLKKLIHNNSEMSISRIDWLSGQVDNASIVEALFKNKPKETQLIQLAVYPSVYARESSHATRIQDGFPDTIHTLTTRISIARDGALCALVRNGEVAPPIVNRAVLSPLDVEGYTLVLGEVAKLDSFLFDSKCPSPELGWSEYLSYCNKLEKTVCDLALLKKNGYLAISSVPFLVSDGSANFSGRIIQLYDTAISHTGDLPLFEAISKGTPKDRIVPSNGHTFGLRAGHMSPAHPLATAQRETLGAVLSLENGEALAVNGPPGTGKTTLLQSVVASFWIAPILGGETSPEAPIIAACSTNNQAVTNIIASFESISEEKANPLAKRWLPGWNSYGAYMANDEKATTSPYPTKQKLAAFEYAAAQDYPATERYFIEHFVESFPGSSATNAMSCAKELRSEIKSRHSLLESIPPLWRSLQGAEQSIKNETCHLSLDVGQIIATFEKSAIEAESQTRKFSEQETQWCLMLGNAPILSNMFAWVPRVASSRDMKALAFLRGISINDVKQEKGLYDKLANIMASRTKKAEDLSIQLRKNSRKFQAKIDMRDMAQRAWASAIKSIESLTTFKGIPLDSASTLQEVDTMCDTVLRRSLFLLATHYWEARWLVCTKSTLVLDIKFGKYEWDQRIRIDAVSQESHRRRALICPVFVSTFHSLPSNFSTSIRIDNGGWQSIPFWNFIDLLVVDEAGQVSPEIGAAGFALARKALVVGDALQIEPVWGVPKNIDLGNAKDLGLFSATKENRAVFLSRGMSASNGSLIKVAQCASPFHANLSLGRGMHLYEHRRCDDAIIQYCNDLCYQGALIPMRGMALRPKHEDIHLPALGYARVPGREERPTSGSVRNPIEAAAVARWIADNQEALEVFYAPAPIAEIIAIVTPYRGQSTAIKRELDVLGLSSAITIGTVHTLQGAERPIVLFSPANSRHAENKNFFWNAQPNLLNVAVSRAKDSFIVFSDMSMFDPTLKTPSGVLGKMLFKADANEIGVDVTSALQAALVKEGKSTTNIRSISTIEDHRAVLKRAFKVARNSIVLTSPWITENAIHYDQVVDMVKATNARGVKVTIYTDSKLNTKEGEEKGKAFSRSVDVLSAAGANVVLVKMIHCKVLYCDDEWKCAGSFNWLSAQREGCYVRRDVSTLIEGADFVAIDKVEEVEALEALRATCLPSTASV